MISYNSNPVDKIVSGGFEINSFITPSEKNLDSKTVLSFGEEWSKFHSFSTNEIEKIGNDYFDLLPANISEFIALDVGCGSGRWAYYLARRIKFIEAIDPSLAVVSAQQLLKDINNVRITQASVSNIPFADASFDLVYSLGVLHHLPDTLGAIKDCSFKLKSKGFLLLYLYYSLDNRGVLFRCLFYFSNALRKIISTLPSGAKKIICDLIALVVYWPLAKMSRVVSLASPKLGALLPLSYYQKTSFFVMRNDALDRFGTPLEKRFSKKEISDMLDKAGFINISFSDGQPYWHVIAQKP